MGLRLLKPVASYRNAERRGHRLKRIDRLQHNVVTVGVKRLPKHARRAEKIISWLIEVEIGCRADAPQPMVGKGYCVLVIDNAADTQHPVDIVEGLSNVEAMLKRARVDNDIEPPAHVLRGRVVEIHHNIFTAPTDRVCDRHIAAKTLKQSFGLNHRVVLEMGAAVTNPHGPGILSLWGITPSDALEGPGFFVGQQVRVSKKQQMRRWPRRDDT